MKTSTRVKDILIKKHWKLVSGIWVVTDTRTLTPYYAFKVNKKYDFKGVNGDFDYVVLVDRNTTPKDIMCIILSHNHGDLVHYTLDKEISAREFKVGLCLEYGIKHREELMEQLSANITQGYARKRK